MNTEPARRSTRQRAAVREILSATREFRTAQQVHEALRARGTTIGLATVYRALQTMTDDREVDVLRTEDGESAYRRCSTGHHHHVVCRGCGTAVEISAVQVEDWACAIAASHGFTQVEHKIELFGLCRACAATDDQLR